MRDRILTILGALAVALAFAVTSAPAPGVDAQNSNTSFYREVVFDSAKVLSADATSSAYTGFADAGLIAFQTVCTEDSGTATLDIALQRSVDGGTTWTSIVSMTQLSATGGETKLYADVRTSSAQMIGNRLRVNYDITGTGQYTCSTYGAAEA